MAANVSGKSYDVRFNAGPSVWAACGQATLAGDGLVFKILRADGSELATHTTLPEAWAGTQTFAPDSFTYVGDGTGVVRLSIETNANASGTSRFAGAVDDIVIAEH